MWIAGVLYIFCARYPVPEPASKLLQASILHKTKHKSTTYWWFWKCAPPIDCISPNPLQCRSASMFQTFVVHELMPYRIFVANKGQQETRKDLLIGAAISVSLKNANVGRPSSRNSRPIPEPKTDISVSLSLMLLWSYQQKKYEIMETKIVNTWP